MTDRFHFHFTFRAKSDQSTFHVVMGWTTDSEAPLSLAALLLLVAFRFCTARGDPHSLSYNFTIDPQPRDDQPWCEVQGEVDQKVFLSYDCGTAKIKYMSPLGEEVKSMSAWEAQTVTLRDTGDLLQGQMHDVTLEKHTDKGPLTLQARMTCWHEDNGHTNASWEFGFNGQLCLLFDSENGHWTVVHPGGRQMKEKWENDRDVTDFFKKVSMGDCQAWLQTFLVCWEKMLKTSESSFKCQQYYFGKSVNTASAVAPEDCILRSPSLMSQQD
ncbi:UL16-binding protein 2-like isoform X2 [Ovis aries]|uniref:UL16-binding protein 2-like isoform X2 n=1 Tax=Ovis aries TaxID=9940 RepID=UPI0029526E80|nr:UL16-binding protein 2-like isoform X2 [Ovis aries]